MIDNNHPITPSLELVDHWFDGDEYDLATKAARWGADHELESCCEWLRSSLPGYDKHYADCLHAARRPKPPSLKKQALAELELLRGDANAHGLGFDAPAICRALEQLDD